MATNAHIGYIEDGKITYTHLHFDGYPEHAGRILYEEYNDLDKVKELVALGYLESIDNDEVIAFHRDKGYTFDDVSPQVTSSLNDFIHDEYREFNYLFDAGTNRWTFYTNLGIFDLETEYLDDFMN